MNNTVSLVAAVAGLLVLAVMLAASPSTKATGQPTRVGVVKRETKPATPALLALPAEREGGAHRPENTTDGLMSTELVRSQGPRPTFPGKPIPFKAAGRE